MSVVGPFRKVVFGGVRERSGGTKTIAFQDQSIGGVAQPIQGGHSKHAVGREEVPPLSEVEIAGQHGGNPFVTFGDEVVEVLIMGRAHGFESEVIQ